MTLLPLILMIAAFVCFTLAAFNVAHTKISLTPLGLALCALVWILISVR